jgi:DNA mismatch repair ATPase MutL
VRFKNNGLDLIEVQDNGTGISPENYESVGELPTNLTVYNPAL